MSCTLELPLIPKERAPIVVVEVRRSLISTRQKVDLCRFTIFNGTGVGLFIAGMALENYVFQAAGIGVVITPLIISRLFGSRPPQ